MSTILRSQIDSLEALAAIFTFRSNPRKPWQRFLRSDRIPGSLGSDFYVQIDPLEAWDAFSTTQIESQEALTTIFLPRIDFKEALASI